MVTRSLQGICLLRKYLKCLQKRLQFKAAFLLLHNTRAHRVMSNQAESIPRENHLKPVLAKITRHGPW